MKVQCDVKELKKGLELVEPAIAGKGGRSDYSTVKLTALPGFVEGGNRLTLLACDTQTVLEATVDAEIESPGIVNVSCKDLMAVLPKKGIVTLERRDKKTLAVQTWEADYALDAMNIADFPEISGMGKRLSVDIRYAITKCIPFVSHEETRHFLKGVLLKSKKTGLECAATDGRMLKVVSVDNRKRKPFEIIVPTKAANIILRKFQDGKMQIGFDKERAIFIQGDLKLATRIIEGVFPDYDPTVGSISDYRQITVDKAALKQKVESVSKVLNYKGGYLERGVLFNTNGDGLKLSTKGEKMSADAVVDAEFSGYGKEAVEFMFNPLMLYKCLDTIAAEEVMFSVLSETMPVGISGDSGDVTILMPMKYDKE